MKYLIIGAVAGGASTAARLRRLDEHAEIIIFEKGAHISYASCGLPYYIGEVIKDRDDLFVQTANSFCQRFNIGVRINTTITHIDAKNKTITAHHQLSDRIYEESYDKLVLAVGAAPVRPPIPGIDNEGIFTLRNVTDTDNIKNYITQKKVKKALIAGAGFIGIEMAESLHNLGIEVGIIEMGHQILSPLDYPMAAIIQQHIRSKGITLHLNTTVDSFSGTVVHLKDGSTLSSDMVILSIGVKPDITLAQAAGLDTGKGILVNDHLQTSDPDIYAVGDVISLNGAQPAYLAGPANKQGRICADNIVYNNTQKYNGAINTAIVKVFDMTVGTTGTAAKQLTVPHLVSTTHAAAHAGYYPGATPLTIQLAFSPADGTILGAQVAGRDGVDKRLDILSAFIQQKRTIHDLIAFEHAYAPPYSSAKDPVNIAGMVAENILLNRMKPCYWHEIPSQVTLIDVRLPEEYHAGHIPGAINIPLDQIRKHLQELPQDTYIYLYCEVGLRGYLAQRILLQNGFTKVLNLSGGYKTWKICTD
jgi:NADPH-dependent 2,4-dienoyl-CoA reductase/sulfur reductase-like enzyme/rhodanese-related sulfurtransferase